MYNMRRKIKIKFFQGCVVANCDSTCMPKRYVLNDIFSLFSYLVI